MGYQVNKTNSCQFQFLGGTYALAIVQDDPYPVASIFVLGPDNQWSDVLTDPPIIDQHVSNDDIMAHGSVAAYLQSLFPIAEKKLAELQATHKPDPADKVACAAYDLGLDVVYNEVSGHFDFNKTPPLSHAR